MKTTVKIIMTAAMLALFSIAADAQIWVNGVEVFTRMTKEQVIAKFGEPTEYEVNDSGDNGVNVWYHYNEDILRFKDNRLTGFTIKSNRISVRVNELALNIFTSNKFSVLESLKPEYMDWFGKDWYCVYCYGGDEKIRFKITDEAITTIVFSESM